MNFDNKLFASCDITILCGVPNAGKSTLTNGLSQDLRRPVIGTGDILRAAVEAGTELGLKAKPLMESGALVPDNLIMGILSEALQAEIAAGQKRFFLDGVPRTLPQAESILAMGIPIARVIFVDIPLAQAKSRASNRRVCKPCGRSYSLIGKYQPKTPGVCDVCGCTLTQRDDDAPEVVENRLTVYMDKTQPVLDFLKSQGIPIFTVDNTSTDAPQLFAEALTK